MADALSPAGFAQAASVKDADVVTLNTCHIRERVSDKLISKLDLLHRSLAAFVTGTENRKSPGAGRRFSDMRNDDNRCRWTAVHSALLSRLNGFFDEMSYSALK